MKLITSLCLFAAIPALGGGFYLNVDAASKSTDVKAKGAFLLARLSGCHEAEKGVLTASAEGVVDGKRRTISLKVVKLDAAGTFAIARQWPEDGIWVVVLTAKHPAFAKPTITAVPVRRDTIEKERAKYVNTRLFTPGEVEQLLR